jgi:hypothetical protein
VDVRDRIAVRRALAALLLAGVAWLAGCSKDDPARVVLLPDPERTRLSPAALEVFTREDTPVPISLEAASGSRALVFRVEVSPQLGVLSGAPPRLIYTPNPNANGRDELEYSVTDGVQAAETARVTIHVLPSNDAPIAHPKVLAVRAGESIEIALSGEDPDGDPVTFRIEGAPSRGRLSASGASFVYESPLHASGSDSFTFRAFDGRLLSEPAQVTISLVPNDVALEALSGEIVTDEDTTVESTLPARYDAAAPLRYRILSGGFLGTATLLDALAGRFSYAPAPDVAGTDRITFEVTDGTFTSNVATVEVTIRPINDVPRAHDAAFSTLEDAALSGTLIATDADGDALTFTVIGAPALGTTTLIDVHRGTFVYVPRADIVGEDSFTFQVSDGVAVSGTATVRISILSAPDGPRALERSFSTDEDLPFSGQLEGVDADGDTLSFRIVRNGSLGTAAVTNPATGAFSYTPNAHVHGVDTLLFRTNDGYEESAPAVVTIFIRSVNDAPVAQPATFEGFEGSSIVGVLSSSDVDGDARMHRIVRPPSFGTAEVLDARSGGFVYTPQPLANGVDSFTFVASDGALESAEATITLVVRAVDQAPIAKDAALTTAEDSTLSGTLDARDPDGTSLVFRIVSAPRFGRVVLQDAATGSFEYTPNANYFGEDSFHFVAKGGGRDSNEGVVRVTVTPVDDAPVPRADTATVLEGASVGIDVLQNDSDPDGETPELVSNEAPLHGTAVLSSNRITYTPDPGFVGVDGFRYTVRDAAGHTAGAFVTVNVLSRGNYAEALQKALFFYEAQRSGRLPNTNRVSWRADSALDDGAAEGVDLSGGFFDGGDHVKFGFPMAGAVTLLAWSLVEHRAAYVQIGQLAFALENLRWATDYLLRAHTREDELWGQVGLGDLDHGFWGPPEVLPMPRPAFKIDSTCPGSDLAAETAAALAASSLVMRPTDAAYADELVSHAAALYRFASTVRGKYSECITDAQRFYPSSRFEDELVFGALWLHRATGDALYLEDARAGYEAIRGVYAWTHSWDEKVYGASVLLAQLVPNEPSYRADVERWLDWWTVGVGAERVRYTPGGLAWLDRWGPLRYAANTAFLALVYSDTLPEGAKRTRYHDFAVQQIRYSLGENPARRSFVVGVGPNPPVRPHHRGAHGSWNGDLNTPTDQRHVLYGALIGGPELNDAFIDDRSDYIHCEVTLDFNAGFVGALARLVLEFGGNPLAGFPVPETPGPQYFVEASIVASGASFVELRALVNNRSAWPARRAEGLAFRYYADLREVIAAGYRPQDVVVTPMGAAATATPMQEWDAARGLYFTEVKLGVPVVPGSATTFRKELLLRLELPGAPAGAFNPNDDPSLAGLPQGGEPVRTTAIPVYEDGVRLEGIDP